MKGVMYIGVAAGLYDTRVIISGQMTEIYQYSRPILTGKQKSRPPNITRGSPGGQREEINQAHRQITSYRARGKLRRLVWSNHNKYFAQGGDRLGSKFLTLTFADNMTSIDEANQEYNRFIKRMNTMIYGRKGKVDLKYLVVPEFQKRGAVHYHSIFFNLPYLDAKKIADTWGNGFIRVNAIQEAEGMVKYVSKYMGKESSDERLQGKKCFWGSRSLLKPQELRYYGKEGLIEVERLAAIPSVKSFSTEFEHPEIGVIQYSQYITEWT